MTPPKARLLDITRLMNRAGLRPTGIDRVEVAYLRALIADPVPVFAIARSALGYILLDQTGAQRVLAALDSDAWGKPDMISRVNLRLSASRRLGQSFVRRAALARCTRHRVSAMLAARLPVDFTYFNVGHSNLNRRMLNGLGAVRKVVLIHDTIPLDYPETQAAGAVDVFAAKLALVRAHADVVICTSGQCAADVARHMAGPGRLPAFTTAHLGVDVAVADCAMPLPTPPYFVTVGTIEPRKNHAMLLDIWADWVDAPPLVICGKRGWNNTAVFARLDAKPAGVLEYNSLSDGQIAALVQGATAMLFASNAEGFGLPPAEALAQGTRVVCADLPVYQEILGDSAVYVARNDRYLWEHAIKKIAVSDRYDPILQFSAPTWAAHFNKVLSRV